VDAAAGLEDTGGGVLAAEGLELAEHAVAPAASSAVAATIRIGTRMSTPEERVPMPRWDAPTEASVRNVCVMESA
jgi:hypothetical protein